MLEDFAALGVLAAILGFFAYTQMPRHWQNLPGLLLITLGLIPAGLIAIALLKYPAVMIPVVFVLGVLVSQRKRAS